MRWLERFFRDEDGVTAVEYAVMLALILMACIVAVGNVGMQTNELMDPGQVLTGTLSSGS